MRALAVNDGPLRSTHRPSDKRDLREGTLNGVVVSPGLTEEDEYGSNLGNAAPPSESPTETAPTAAKSNNTLLIGGGIALLVFIIVVVARRKKS